MNIKTNNRRIVSGRPITASVNSRATAPINRNLAKLTPEQRIFANQLINNTKKSATSIMAATNTTNIAAKPDFLELLPMFVQKLVIQDVFGTVAMNSRQQLIPYFEFVAENTKGETNAGDVFASPFANRQGVDPNFTGRTIKNEIVGENFNATAFVLAYTPVLPSSVSLKLTNAGVTTSYIDDGNGNITDNAGTIVGYINYSTGAITFTASQSGEVFKATYQYDNENVGAREPGNGGYGYEYGAQMGKGYLKLNDINIKAEAHQLACYWSVYSAFAADKEYGGNIADIAKEAAFSQITAEINSTGFNKLSQAASLKPQFDWDASLITTGSVAPVEQLNMFKLKLGQAASDIYQRTGLAMGNRLIVGSNVANYIRMMYGFTAAPVEDAVGPYKLGTLDNFEVYVAPSYDPNKWVMACKSQDIRRSSALMGMYLPLTATDPIALANASVQSGMVSMYGMEIVNPASIVSGRIVGLF